MRLSLIRRSRSSIHFCGDCTFDFRVFNLFRRQKPLPDPIQVMKGFVGNVYSTFMTCSTSYVSTLQETFSKNTIDNTVELSQQTFQEAKNIVKILLSRDGKNNN
eukprot:m.168455 g.168455  ORF g.168455 m.168455 type:complete len:104 (+) comp14477_c1_seq3:1800-2111(+)